jgi:xanthine dehydrogenase accessory factor
VTQQLAQRVTELVDARVPFVHATVVRAEQPTSARPGDAAIVFADGSVEGFVGGHCAEGSVRAAALTAIGDGRAVLLRVVPDDTTAFPDVPGAAVVTNPCLSGGALEIFLEPRLPPPLVAVVGSSPITAALAAMASRAGFVVERAGAADQPPAGAVAVIVASLGNDETTPIRAALDAGVGYVGLVASRRRGESVLAGLGLTEAERARVHTPVGLDIGAVTAEEIALSVLAGLVQAIRRDGLRPPPVPESPPVQAVDPVCGMTVVVRTDTPSLEVDGQTFWFCGTGCRNSYAAAPGS